jgi:hypothetical protein
MMATKVQTYQVTARLVVLASIDVKAESFEDALEQSKTLRETDFVKFKGEFLDGSMKIGQVCVNKYWDTDQD